MDPKLKSLFEAMIAATIAGETQTEKANEDVRQLLKLKSRAILAELADVDRISRDDDVDAEFNDRLGSEEGDDLDGLDDELEGELGDEDDLGDELDDDLGDEDDLDDLGDEDDLGGDPRDDRAPRLSSRDLPRDEPRLPRRR